jgi:hypothetical protein
MQRTGRGAAGGVSRRLQPAVGAGGEQQRWRGGVGDGHYAEVGRPICYFLDASVCSMAVEALIRI